MIRLFKQEDIERIMEIGNSAWREIYKMFNECYGDELFEILMPNTDTITGNSVKSFADAHPDCIFICEEDRIIVGFITFYLDCEKKIVEIGYNAVDPEVRHKGIGQQMYRAVFEHFREKGMKYAKVSTGLDYSHAPARRAYERAGFNIHHENVTYFMKL